MTTIKDQSQVLEVKLHTETKRGLLLAHKATIKVTPTRIFFEKAPFALKDEIKSMSGAKWHGYDEIEPMKKWSIDNSHRNWFQLKYLMNQNPYEWFEQPIKEFHYRDYYVNGSKVTPRDHQFLLANGGLTYHYQIWAAEMGTGKLNRLTTPVLTPTGWSTMGQLRVGDRLIDPEGGECEVLSLHPQNKKEVFRVTFTDGSSNDCGSQHLWRVITPLRKWRGQDYQVLETQELVARGLQHSNGNNKWFIPMVEPVDFDEQHLECHPYVMGYLIGNAHFPQYKVSIPDQETVDRLNSFMSQPLKPTNSTLRGEKIDYIIKCPKVRAAIDNYGLQDCLANNKFVPKEFLFNTVSNRLYLMQGLFDSDGTPIHSSGIEYSSASQQLSDDVKFLVQSFGGTCGYGLKEYPTYTYKGKKKVGQPSHRLNCSLNSNTTPFLLSRKAKLYVVPTKYEPTRAIVSVESVGFDECICIRVSSPTHCYVTDEFIVTHNTLAAQMVMEHSGVNDWFWVGPLKAIENIEIEFQKWGLSNDINLKMTTYERLVTYMRNRSPGDPVPQGIIFDESSRLKSPTAQRSKAAQDLADLIRETYGRDGFCILMSGTPSPKSPLDWWKQLEVCWPGYLREGSQKALKERLAFMVDQTFDDAVVKTLKGWKDDENKCAECGDLYDDGNHEPTDSFTDFEEMSRAEPYHKFTESINEVAFMYERLDGLVTVLHKKDVLDLPDKIYEIDVCEPSPSVLRAAQALMEAAPNAITGMTWLREVSDGFMYKDVEDGTKKCNICTKSEQPGKVQEWFDPENPEQGFEAIDFLDEEFVSRLQPRWIDCKRCGGSQQMKKFKKITKEIPCPKEQKLADRLEQCEETGRIVIFAGFQGSLDRIEKLCHKNQWDVVRCDGRGWHVTTKDNKVVRTDEPLRYWLDFSNQRVAFVAHPQSGGLSLNLTESRMAVFYSNDFNPESRSQAEDRIHRMGCDENIGCKIVDIFHLPSDTRVRQILRENRKLELMTMGEFSALQVQIINAT